MWRYRWYHTKKKTKEYIKRKSPLLIFIENKNRHSYACLEIRSRSEEAINSTQNRIYSLEVFFFFFTSCFIDVGTLYLFLNWFSTLVSDDRKYVCCRRLYACIITRKFKGLDSGEITSLPGGKSDLRGTSFQSRAPNENIVQNHLNVALLSVF